MPCGSSGLSRSAMRCADLVEVVDAERLGHPALRAEDVDRQRHPSARRVLEQQRRAAARAPPAATMPVTSRCGSTGRRDPGQVAVALERGEEVLQIGEGHGHRRQYPCTRGRYRRAHGRRCCWSRTTRRSAPRSPARCASTGTSSPRSAPGMPALTAAVEQKPDVVLLDLGLPDIDGADVLSMLRAVSDVPVIVATARDDEARDGARCSTSAPTTTSSSRSPRRSSTRASGPSCAAAARPTRTR